MDLLWKISQPAVLVVIVWTTIIIETLVNADVYVRSQNETEPITYFLDLMADFGPEVPDSGISGYLHPVKPLNACLPVAPPPDNTSVWIALIARDNCTFVEKVRNVQASGYSLAIVFNRKDQNKLETMHGDGSGINIPSVFVGWSDGQLLQTNYCYFCRSRFAASIGNYIVTVDNKEYSYNPYLLWPFAVVVGTCFILMLAFMVFKWCRDLRKKRKSRLSSKHLKKIPTKKFKKGDDYDVCAICLDDYDEGDKLRILPCSHAYHCTCIDPWLTKNKRSCPICKRKVFPGDDAESESDSEDDGEAPSERTPLLGGGGPSGNNNNTRSTFDNSGLPGPVQPQRVHNVQDATETDTDSSDSEYGAVGGAPVSHTQTANQSRVGRASNTETANQRKVDGASNTEAANGKRASPAALKTEIVSEIHNESENRSKRPVSKTKSQPVKKEIVSKKETVDRDIAANEQAVAKDVAKETVVKKEVVAREVARGEDNDGYEGESDSSDSFYVTDSSSEVYFADQNKKEEKRASIV